METIAAIATPLSTGGIAIIRISGDNAIEVADKVFRSQSGVMLKDKKGYTAAFGSVYSDQSELDTSVAVVYRAPKSYTGEDVVELSCHGGLYITKEVLRATLKAGARIAEAGEFTKRAYLNGKLGLTQAEAVIGLINSKNTQSQKSAKSQMDGLLYKEIEQLKLSLLTTAGHLAAWVDYPEEDIEEVERIPLTNELKQTAARISKLLQGYDTGKVYKEGIDTAIIGKPNVGKSTLMNLLVGEQKSIVTEIAGTTRDIIEEKVLLGDIILKLSDTAGIRETADTVEQFGVQKARKAIEKASLVLAVFDSSTEIADEDKQIIEQLKTSLTIAIVNKTDLPQKIDTDYLKSHFKNIVSISAINDEGVQELKQIICDELHLNDIDSSSLLLANERQRSCALTAEQNLNEAITALEQGVTFDAVTVSVEVAIDALMELTGERVTTELVNQVFSHFCVGK